METKSTSQTPRILIKNAILLAITALALSASPSSRAIEPCPNKVATFWTYQGTGDWFTSSHWSNGVPVCNEDISYDTQINNGGTAQISTGSASACEVVLGNNPMDSGGLSVDGSGSSLTTCTGVFVGQQGRGKLSITNGGAVTTNGVGNIAWGTTSMTSSNGAATVDGTNSKWTVVDELDIGGTTNMSGGTGLLTVTNGGTVTAANAHVYKSGTLTGNGTFSTTSGTIFEGTLVPNGTLTVGGALTFTGFTANMHCSVSSTSVDKAVVSGAAALSGKLFVTLNGSFTGDFTLLHANGGLGTTSFSSYSFIYTGCLSPSIVYDRVNGDVILHVETSCQ